MSAVLVAAMVLLALLFALALVLGFTMLVRSEARRVEAGRPAARAGRE